MGKKTGNTPAVKKEQSAQPESVVSLLKPSLDGISQCIYKLNTAGTTSTAQSARGKRSRDTEKENTISSSEEVDELYSVLTDHLTSLGELLEVYQKALLPCAAIIVSHLLPILSRHRAPVEAWRCAASCATLFGSAAVPLLKSIGENLVADLQNPNKLLGRGNPVNASSGPALLPASESTSSNGLPAGPAAEDDEQQTIPTYCAIVLHPLFAELEKFTCLVELLYGCMEFACTSGNSEGLGEGQQSFAATVAGIVVRVLSAWRLCPLSFALAVRADEAGSSTIVSPFERNDVIAEVLAEFCTAVVAVSRPLLPEVLGEAHQLITSTRPYSVKTRAAIARLKATIGSVQHPTVIPVAVSTVVPSLPSFALAPVAASSANIGEGAVGDDEVAGAGDDAPAHTGMAVPSRFGASSKSAAASLLSTFLAPAPEAVSSSPAVATVAAPTTVVESATIAVATSAPIAAAQPVTLIDDGEIPMIVDSDDE